MHSRFFSLCEFVQAEKGVTSRTNEMKWEEPEGGRGCERRWPDTYLLSNNCSIASGNINQNLLFACRESSTVDFSAFLANFR